MKKINTFIDKNIIKIMTIFLLLGPVIDVVTSLQIHYSNLSFSVGMVFKVLFLLLLCYYHVFIKEFKNKKIIIYLFLMFIYVFLNLFIVNDFNISNASGIFRIMFFPLSLILCYFIFKEKKTEIGLKTIRVIAVIYGVLIIIPALTNTAFDSYAVAKKGSLGWFNSANEISAILAIILPFIFYNLFNKFKPYKIIPLLIVVVTIFIIGTKTPLFSLLVCIIVFGAKLLIRCFKNKHYGVLSAIFAFSIIAVITSIIVIPKTNIYKNTIIHLEYLNVEKVSDLFNYKTIDHFMFGSRLKFLEENHQSYANSGITKQAFGMGFNNDKLVEMDVFDILYRGGIVGFILFIAPLIMVLLNLRNYSKKYTLSIMMILFSSFLAGHVLTAPSVSILVSVIICEALLNKKFKTNVVITAYDFNYGGVETALLTLLKNLNYEKMNVTVYLEKKQGVFLGELPKAVKIKEYRPYENKNIIVRKLLNLFKQIMFIITESDSYDASITYATYSLPGVFIGLNASQNPIIFVHSNYKYVYDENENEIRQFFNQRKISKFNHIVFVSNEARNDFVSYYPKLKDKLVTINNLIDYDRIINGSKENLKIKKSKITFLFVGRLEERSKKISRIIEVAKRFENDNRVQFWIVGDGPDKKTYEQEITKNNLNNVIMHGSKKNPYPYMKLCDYVILTSDYEGFPVVYGEAMVLKKPIITTIDVSDEFFSINKRFGVVTKKNADDIYQNILKLLDNGFVIKEEPDFKKFNLGRIKMIEQLVEEDHEKI